MSSITKESILNEYNLLKQELTCRICLDLYTEPVTLIICQHTFCLECYKELFSNVKSPKSIRCPICKRLINRRSYYINEQFQATIELLQMFNKVFTSWEEGMAYVLNNDGDSVSRLEKYLDDCVQEQLRRNEIFTLSSSDDNSCNELAGNPKDSKTTTNVKHSDVPKRPKRVVNKITPLKCVKTKRKQPKKRIKVTGKENNIEEPTKNDNFNSTEMYKINTEENKIVQLIEDDFLQNIENEFKDKTNNDKSITKKAKKYESNFNWNKKTADVSKKTSLDWSRIESVNKKIEKEEKKYKQLNVSTELNKSKSKTQETVPVVLVERLDISTDKALNQNEAPIEIKTEDVSNEKLDLLLKYVEEDKRNNDNRIDNDLDDVFLVQTQVLNDNQNNNEQTNKLEISPSKLIVDVEVHHNLNGTPNNRVVENVSGCTNKSFENKSEDKDEYGDVISATEKTPESIKQIGMRRKNLRSATKNKPSTNTKTVTQIVKRKFLEQTKIVPVDEEKNIAEKQKEIKLDLKIANEKKSAMIASLENSLNHINAVLSQCSNFVNSESLFSDSHCSKESKKTKKSPVPDQYYSLPLPTPNQSSPEFLCTVIPYLKNINSYYSQIISLSDKICSETEVIKNNLGSKENEKLIEIRLDLKANNTNVEIQTEPLKCPKCSYNFTSENNLLKSVENSVKINDLEYFSNELTNKNCTEKSQNNNTKNSSQITLKSNENTNSKKVNRQLTYNDDSNKCQKRKYKRIRSPTSDSDSESDKSKKYKSNYSKLLYRDDLDVIFHSETSDKYFLSLERETNESIRNIVNECDKDMQNMFSEEKEIKRKSQDTQFDTLLKSDQNISQHDLNNTILDNLLDNVNLTGSENNNLEPKNCTQKYVHDNSNHDILSSSMFLNSEKLDKNKSLHKEHLDIVTKNLTVDQNHDNELDKEVENLTIPVFEIDDSFNSDKDIFEDDNIVESTPQKTTENKRDKSKFISENNLPEPVIDLIDPPTQKENANSIEVVLLPPSEFQDSEKYGNPSVNIPNISSATPDIFGENLLNKDLFQSNSSQDRSVCKSATKNLNPIVLAQKEKFSPLQIIKSNLPPKPVISQSPKQQQSIFKYMKPSNERNTFAPIKENLQIEVCESPVPSSFQTNKSASDNNSNNDICIVYTRLTRDEISAVESAVSKFRVKCNKNFTDHVTHLVVSVDDRNRLKNHTMKYLLAIANSVWVVSFAWIRDSLQHNRLLPEELYEVLDVSGNPGPKISRLTRLTNPLLKNFVIHCADPIATVNKQELEGAIIKLGGEIRTKPNDLAKEKGKICLILSETNVTQDFYNYQIWRNTLNVLVVDIEWLSRTVGQYQIASVRPYILCLDEGINNLGYPWDLIAPVAETQLTINTSH